MVMTIISLVEYYNVKAFVFFIFFNPFVFNKYVKLALTYITPLVLTLPSFNFTHPIQREAFDFDVASLRNLWKPTLT
jgi:hypothetical protein